jgi:pimeloyl-ACP methyl ester carboxylesterase
LGHLARLARSWQTQELFEDISVAENLAVAARHLTPLSAIASYWSRTSVDDERVTATLELLDLTRVGMSGHSFGALTTQALSGQADPEGDQTQNDRRIRAAIIMSPAIPAQGDVRSAFAAVGIPWLLLTG